jgi:hypothetical protein
VPAWTATDDPCYIAGMEFTPEYEESHLVVAAVRVLTHRDGRSPTPAEVAELLQVVPERVNILVHELRKRGILKALLGPFEMRLDPGDPALIESLPRGASGPSIAGELEEFHSQLQEKKREMERMFRGGEADRRRKDRVAKLELEFTKFKPKRGAADDLFKRPETEDG